MVGVSPTPGAAISLVTLPNLRELGGWRSADGRTVRSGLVFRSTDLNKLSRDDACALSALGIQTIYDFRSVAERTSEPDVALPGVVSIPLDVLADSPQAVPGNLTSVLSDPVMLAGAQSRYGGSIGELMLDSYAQLVKLPSAQASYRRFYQGLLGADPAPVLFHCTTGKDRTGWAAATFLALMGVPETDIYAEYLLTNEQLAPALEPVFAAFEDAGGDREMLRPVLGVERSYLQRAFAEVRDTYGSIGGYFASGLGIGTADQDRLRNRYLTE